MYPERFKNIPIPPPLLSPFSYLFFAPRAAGSLLPRFRIAPLPSLPLLLNRCSLTVEAVRLFPRTHGAAPPAHKSKRRRNVGGFEGQAERRFVCVERHGLCFTRALLRAHCLPAVRFALNAPLPLVGREPFAARFVVVGLSGA